MNEIFKGFHSLYLIEGIGRVMVEDIIDDNSDDASGSQFFEVPQTGRISQHCENHHSH